MSEQHLAFVEGNFADVERALQRVGELNHLLHDDEDDDWEEDRHVPGN